MTRARPNIAEAEPVAPHPDAEPGAAGMIRHVARRSARHARVIAIASGKGGVGKTNIAVNLAIALGTAGRRVLLVDADLGLANVDLLLGERPRGDLGHVLAGRMALGEIIQDGPAGIRWIPGASQMPAIARVGERRREALLASLTALEDHHDFVLLDAPAGVGLGVLHLARQADELLLVTTPEPTAMMDAYALLKALATSRTSLDPQAPSRIPHARPVAPGAAQTAHAAPVETASAAPAGPQGDGAGRVRLVVNMVTHRDDAARVHERIRQAAGRFLGLRVDLLGYVFCDGHVGRAVQRQQPLVLAYPHSQAAWCIKQLAAAVLEGSDDGGSARFAFFMRLANLFAAG